MRTRGPVYLLAAFLFCLLPAIPADVAAQGGQSAGKITLVVPTAYLVRASQQMTAAASTPVMWGDVINTGHLARARIALTDGSILNVGSDSNLTVAKHDAGAQQTDLDLNYGRVRAKAVKLVKPDAHFQIRTAVGVAGVVGTEMIVGYEATPSTTSPAASLAPVQTALGDAYANESQAGQAAAGADDFRRMTLLCMEGSCRLCDNHANCVLMKGGQFSTIRGNSTPSQPAPVPPTNLTEFVNTTKVTPPPTAITSTGFLAGGIAAGGAAVGTAVARAVATTKTCPTPAPTGGVITGTRGVGPRPAASGCTTITRGGVARR
jgi:FecR protein